MENQRIAAPGRGEAVSLGLMMYEEDRFDPEALFTVEQALISLSELAQNPARQIVLTYVPAQQRTVTSAPNGSNVEADGSSAASTTAQILSDLRRK